MYYYKIADGSFTENVLAHGEVSCYHVAEP